MSNHSYNALKTSCDSAGQVNKYNFLVNYLRKLLISMNLMKIES